MKRIKTSSNSRLTRRAFIATSAGTVLAAQLNHYGFAAADENAPRQASGTKLGEVTSESAILWTRVTASPVRNNTGLEISGRVERRKKGEPKKTAAPLPVPVPQLEGACPGAPGRVRVRYGTREDLSGAKATDWVKVTEATDFTNCFALTGLKPATVYYYETETSGPDDGTKHGSLRGKFETAPTEATPSDLRFCVTTCQAYRDRDHKDGFNIYPAMLALAPKFIGYTGDNVYYDSDAPKAVTPELARYHWERMFSMPLLTEVTRNIPGYWEKDDHDTLSNDCWPGMTSEQLLFADGQKIFLQQVPMSEKNYRTFRWGRDLQIWLTEGRDFRSVNTMEDGPEKTIWGREQKEWFKRTVKESSATWKVLINATPVVGPDRGAKDDNLSNTGFTHEGDEIRSWLQANVPDNFFVITGDRHWQYHSVHPKTGLGEFACGPASDEHAEGSPGEDKTYHRFHRVKGGFLSVTLKQAGAKSAILFEHRDVLGKVVYSWGQERKV